MSSSNAIVIDSYLQPADEETSGSCPIDFTLRNKGKSATKEIFFSAPKSPLSAHLEAVTEYSRIVFDLFPLSNKPTKDDTRNCSQITLIIPQDAKQPLDKQSSQKQWNGTPQNIRDFSDWIAKHNIQTKQPKLLDSLREAAQVLHNTKRQTTKRIICLLHKTAVTESSPAHCTTQEGSEESINIVEFVNETMEVLQKGRTSHDEIEMVIICSTMESERKMYNIQVGDIRCGVFVTPIGGLIETVQNIAGTQFRLRCVRITGIPMKTDAHNASNTYDVLLLHPADDHFLSSDLQAPQSSLDANEITLQWKVDKTINKSLLTCSCIHRLTTVSLFSSPTQCLTKYLIGEKPVTLVHMPKEGETSSKQPITHLVILQGQQMYLHCLKPLFKLPQPEKGMRKFYEFYGQNDAKLRTDAFSRIISSNILHPRVNPREQLDFVSYSVPMSESESQQILSSRNMIINTMWFPYYVNSTIICQPQNSQELNNMLAALYQYFTSDTISQEEVATGIQIIQKIYHAIQTTDVAYLPGTSVANRTHFYTVLWEELTSLSRRSYNFYKEKKSSELTDYIKKLTENNSQDATEAMQIDSPLQQQSVQNLPQRSSSPTRSGSNSGDLTHAGTSLEQERKRRKFSHRPDPFESVDQNSLFSTYWNGKLKKISPIKNVL